MYPHGCPLPSCHSGCCPHTQPAAPSSPGSPFVSPLHGSSLAPHTVPHCLSPWGEGRQQQLEKGGEPGDYNCCCTQRYRSSDYMRTQELQFNPWQGAHGLQAAIWTVDSYYHEVFFFCFRPFFCLHPSLEKRSFSCETLAKLDSCFTLYPIKVSISLEQ